MCVDNCQRFQGIDVEYQLEIVDRNVSVDLQSCYSAVGIVRGLREVSGVLYVNDTEAFRRAECQELQYVVVAQEQQQQLQAKTQLLVIFEDDSESLFLSLDTQEKNTQIHTYNIHWLYTLILSFFLSLYSCSLSLPLLVQYLDIDLLLG